MLNRGDLPPGLTGILERMATVHGEEWAGTYFERYYNSQFARPRYGYSVFQRELLSSANIWRLKGWVESGWLSYPLTPNGFLHFLFNKDTWEEWGPLSVRPSGLRDAIRRYRENSLTHATGLDYSDSITLSDLAAQLPFSYDSLATSLQEGSIQGQKMGGQWFIPASEVKRVFGESGTRMLEKRVVSVEFRLTVGQLRAVEREGKGSGQEGIRQLIDKHLLSGG